jgi:hypothetical protein
VITHTIVPQSHTPFRQPAGRPGARGRCSSSFLPAPAEAFAQLKPGDSNNFNTRLALLPGIPMPVLHFILRGFLPLAAWTLNRSMGSLKTLSSTLQSLRRGRPTEIDFFNGEIVRMGQQVGMATPYDARVVEL